VELLIAEGHLNGRRSGAISGRIVTLPVPTDGGRVTKVSNGISLAGVRATKEALGNLGSPG